MISRKVMSINLKKRLYLDLDLTLVYTATHELGFVAYDFSFKLADCVTYYVYLRPHLKEFLDFCLAHFEVGIITSATQDYTHEILDGLTVNKERFINITTREKLSINSVIKVGESGRKIIVEDYVKVVNNAILVDDKDYVMQGSNNFLIKAAPFHPLGEEDQELLNIIETLKSHV